MKNRRIFVEKYSRFQVEAETLRNELNTNLGLSIEHLRFSPTRRAHSEVIREDTHRMLRDTSSS